MKKVKLKQITENLNAPIHSIRCFSHGMHLFLSPSLGLRASLGALRLAVEPPVVEVEVDDPLPTDLADRVAVQVVPVLVPLQAPQPRVHLSAVAAGELALAALLVDLGHVQPEEPLR